MGFKRATISLVLAVIVVGCFAASLSQQKNFRFRLTEEPGELQLYSDSYRAITVDKIIMLAVSPIFTVEAPSTAPPTFSNSTRTQIFDFISANPGVQFRAVCAGLCIPVGLAQYHLGVLIKAGLVGFIRDGKYKRFFVAKKFSAKEMAIISLLRHSTAKRLVKALLRKGSLSHGRLAGEICISSQALTWQIKSFGDKEFMLQVNEGTKTIYKLNDSCKTQIEACLSIINQA